MKIAVKAKPDSCEDKLVKINETRFAAEVREPSIDGRANRAIIRLLAAHFNIFAFKIRLIKGAREKSKIFEINEF